MNQNCKINVNNVGIITLYAAVYETTDAIASYRKHKEKSVLLSVCLSPNETVELVVVLLHHLGM